MPPSGFLSLPRKARKALGKARSETDVTQDPSEPGQAMRRPTESNPDLGAGPSALPTITPSTSQNQVSGGTRTVLFRTAHLTVLDKHRQHRFRSHPTRHRKGQTPEALGSVPQSEHHHERGQAQVESAVHCICFGQGGHRCRQGILRCVPSPQVCCEWPICCPQTL